MPGYPNNRMMGGPMGNYNRSPMHRYNDESEQDPEQHNKLFIGGLSFETSETGLKAYFSKWGEIKDCIVMRDSATKRSRGFGFIKYKAKESIDEVQKARPHKIDDRDVETKRAMPRDDPMLTQHQQQTIKKMFIGGMKEDTSEECIRNLFEDFGDIENVEMITDKNTGKTKGFCFVTFKDYDPVDKLVLKKRIELNGKKVELKKAFAKGEMPQHGRSPMGMGMQMNRGGRGDYSYGGGPGYGPGGYGGYGQYNGGGGGYGGPNPYYDQYQNNYGPPQGNQRDYYNRDMNDSRKNYGGGNNYNNRGYNSRR